jgi:hypothetical protein
VEAVVEEVPDALAFVADDELLLPHATAVKGIAPRTKTLRVLKVRVVDMREDDKESISTNQVEIVEKPYC